ATGDAPRMPRKHRLDALREWVRRHDLLLAAYLVCLCLILIVTNTQIYRWTFYAPVLPWFALAADRRTLAGITRSWTWPAAVALLFYLWLTVLWGDDPNLRDAGNFARRLGMIALFVTITAFLAAARPDFPRLLYRSLILVAAVTALIEIGWFMHSFGTL